MISEKGSIDGNGSIRLLLSVHQLKHTGILYMKNEDVLKVLYFNRGRLLWAISNAGEDQLETVLIRHSVVNANQLRLVKEDLPVNASIGKRLVEKNILTLDDLVRYTRIQLQQIVFSILKWQQGGFQFVKDSPPQRLLSLDLDLTELVAAFILKKIDMTRIWEELGSFQTILVPVEDMDRFEATGLTSSQEKLLHTFDGQRDLQAVVSRYAEEHQESLLKVVFYLKCAGLLSEKIVDSPQKQVTEEAFDTVGLLFADEEQTEKKPPPVSYQFQMPDESETARTKAFVAQEAAEETPETEEEENLADTLLDGMGDKSRRRLSNWTYLMILGILIVGGTVLFMLSRGSEPARQPLSKEVPIQTRPSEPLAETPDTPQQMTPIETVAPPPVVMEQPVQEKEAVPPPPVVQKPVAQPDLPSEAQDPWMLTRKGRYQDAGTVWAEQMRRQGVLFSILLELDCQVESVQHALKQFTDTRDLFLLNRRRGGQNCYLVMWGRFQDEKSAAAAYPSIPAYFTSQENPPKIIALGPYLHKSP